jgi:transcriptional regulator with XRE-family HTH domain
MPFNKKSLLDLRDRQGWCMEKLAENFDKFAERKGLVKTTGDKIRLTQEAISYYERGLRNPRMRLLDALYQYADSLGHEDIQFYIRPRS